LKANNRCATKVRIARQASADRIRSDRRAKVSGTSVAYCSPIWNRWSRTKQGLPFFEIGGTRRQCAGRLTPEYEACRRRLMRHGKIGRIACALP
jgi:hypothetical protein